MTPSKMGKTKNLIFYSLSNGWAEIWPKPNKYLVDMLSRSLIRMQIQKLKPRKRCDFRKLINTDVNFKFTQKKKKKKKKQLLNHNMETKIFIYS